MSLHATLKVNGDPVGMFEAQRRHRPGGGTDPDEVNTYDVCLSTEQGNVWVAVQHRYGDGAWALVRAGIDAVEVAHEARRPE
jgi:hypothetical protein